MNRPVIDHEHIKRMGTKLSFYLKHAFLPHYHSHYTDKIPRGFSPFPGTSVFIYDLHRSPDIVVAQKVVNNYLEKEGSSMRIQIRISDGVMVYRIIEDPARIGNRLGLLDI